MIGRLLRSIFGGDDSSPDTESSERERVQLVIRGTELLGEGDVHAAIEAYDAAIAGGPPVWIAHRQRGIAYTHLGNFTRSVESILRGTRWSSTDVTTCGL